MDYKEKLRLAKEALDSGSYDKETIEYIFPELKENDDTRVKNKLIEFFKGYCPDKEWWGNITQGNILAWLEEHDEQKSWSKEDEMQLDAAIHLVSSTGHIETMNWLKALKDKVQPQLQQGWSEEDELNLSEALHHIRMYNLAYKADKLDKWLKSLKERVQSHLKHELSEKDYNEIETIACHLDNTDNEGMAEVLRNIRDKYYDIIPQNTWKPSDEQMEQLLDVYNGISEGWQDSVIESLYNDLKKLREE